MFTIARINCPECEGTGYQNIIGHPGAAGRCVSCGPKTAAALKKAAEIIVAGFCPQNCKNPDFISEAVNIIERELAEGL